MGLSKAPDIGSVMSYDPATIATLRRALDEVLFDERFYRRKSASALEVAEHLLAQAAAGERDLEKLKSSAFEKLFGKKQQFPDRAA
jgi:UDP:flavonoid glycosyltransferase YjiC (YdhE family)